jgi:hypothetical protein
MGLLNIELNKGSKFKYSPDEEDTTLALMREMACLEASFSERNIDASPLTYAEVCTVVAALERSNSRYLSVGRDDGSRVFNKHPADETLFDPRTNAANMATMPDEGAGSHGIYVYNKSMTIDRWRRTVNKFELSESRTNARRVGRLVWSGVMKEKIIAAAGSPHVTLDVEYTGYAWGKTSSGKKRCDNNKGRTTSLKGAIDEAARRVEEDDGDDPDESERRFYVMFASDNRHAGEGVRDRRCPRPQRRTRL